MHAEDCQKIVNFAMQRSNCCCARNISLSIQNTPPELMRLWSRSDSSDARQFCDNIRYINNHLSFTSLYCHVDSMTTNIRKSYVCTFMILLTICSISVQCFLECKGAPQISERKLANGPLPNLAYSHEVTFIVVDGHMRIVQNKTSTI